MNADRNLLFGLLAMQNDFIDERQLVAAFGAWIADHASSLEQILIQQGALQENDRLLLSQLVEHHIATRGGDVTASLQAISSVGSVSDELQRLADTEIQASISKLRPPNSQAFATTVGQSTSKGQRFEIRRPLDRSGLGIVSVAVDKELNREVALKEIRGDRADDISYRTKFLLEAEVTGGLEHPGIVPVYGLGSSADGRPYYAMRLIKGDNLQHHIKRFHASVNTGNETFDGPALRKLLRRFLDVCQAIDYAHSRGVLHRDLKPGNIMLGKYGETLVVDWGLAKPLGAQPRQSSQEDVSDNEPSLVPSGSHDGMTMQGSIVGTAAYAPPEQLSGNLEQVSERSDVYGLGAMLYELLTGMPPAQGKTLNDVIETVLAGEIKPPRKIQTQTPKALEAICLRAISRFPADRYASAFELGQEIECWLDDLPVNANPDRLWNQISRAIRREPAWSMWCGFGFIGILELSVDKVNELLRWLGLPLIVGEIDSTLSFIDLCWVALGALNGLIYSSAIGAVISLIAYYFFFLMLKKFRRDPRAVCPVSARRCLKVGSVVGVLFGLLDVFYMLSNFLR